MMMLMMIPLTSPWWDLDTFKLCKLAEQASLCTWQFTRAALGGGLGNHQGRSERGLRAAQLHLSVIGCAKACIVPALTRTSATPSLQCPLQKQTHPVIIT
jgi:hypothetical protein